LSERLSRRYPAKKLTDIDYADDLDCWKFCLWTYQFQRARLNPNNIW